MNSAQPATGGILTSIPASTSRGAAIAINSRCWAMCAENNLSAAGQSNATPNNASSAHARAISFGMAAP